MKRMADGHWPRLWLIATLSMVVGLTTAAEIEPQRLACRGNEPFWSVELGPDNALLRRLGADPAEVPYRGALVHFDDLGPGWLIWRGSALRADNRTLVVTIRAEACLDTMADGPAARYRALVSFADASAAHGCCTTVQALGPHAAGVATFASKLPINEHHAPSPDTGDPLLPPAQEE